MNILKSFASLWVCVCLGWLAFGPTAEREAARRDLREPDREFALAAFRSEVERETREILKFGPGFSDEKFARELALQKRVEDATRELRNDYRATSYEVVEAANAGMDAAGKR